MVEISPVRPRRGTSPNTTSMIRRRSRRRRRRLDGTAAAGPLLLTSASLLLLLACWAGRGGARMGWPQQTPQAGTPRTVTNNNVNDYDDETIDPNDSHPHLRISSSSSSSSTAVESATGSPSFDVVIVGSGLAGLTAALEALDRGGRVALVEKEATLGGNSLKASSGINACCSENASDTNNGNHDSLAVFERDTIKSAGIHSNHAVFSLSPSSLLIHELVESSEAAVQWLQERVGVDLSQVAQLGGHSFARTHRPAAGMVGAELMAHLEELILSYSSGDDGISSDEGEAHVTLFTNTKVVQLLQASHGHLSGVRIKNKQTHAVSLLQAPQVVLATGGFASDRNSHSLLSKVRPDLISFGTTGGSFSTGDGISLAQRVGATTVDLDQIQLHPTGFVDPYHPQQETKVLAAELLRGVGGILLNHCGKRFCNELGTRDYVTKTMLAHDNCTSSTNNKPPTFTLVLTAQAALGAQRHVELYTRKGLLTQVQGLRALSSWMVAATDGSSDVTESTALVNSETLYQTFANYESALTTGTDAFGKTIFPGFSEQAIKAEHQWEEQVFYVAMVTPVLHYCMGGVAIDVDGRVLTKRGSIIPGLYAAGEVTGGVHGKNRLGGNSLLECTVYGRRIGQRLKLGHGHAVSSSTLPAAHRPHQHHTVDKSSVKVSISWVELQLHATSDDLWIAIHGLVYNLTDFAHLHPGGASIVEHLAGSDASLAFDTVHTEQLLQRFHLHSGQSVVMGRFDATTSMEGASASTRYIPPSELHEHSTAEDCWVVFHGTVFDMTEFSKTHKGGAYLIQKYAGKDATETYKAFHKREKLDLVASYRVGVFQAQPRI